LLAAVVRELGDVDLVLCGRQGSDYDQGTVPAVLAESLNAAFVTLAAGIAPANSGVRVPRVTPLGEEVVEATFPAVVTVSNEIGVPRYPTSRGMLDARRKQIEVREASALLAGNTPESGVEIVEVFVPQVQGNCQEVIGATPEEKARALMQLLSAAGAFNV
jgi:electron transfer flavoprotein beta subunit